MSGGHGTEVFLSDQIWYDRQRLAMGDQAVFLPQRLHCVCLMKPLQNSSGLSASMTLSHGCETLPRGVHSVQTNNFGLQMEMIQPYCLKANQEKNRKESFGNVMSDMIDEERMKDW